MDALFELRNVSKFFEIGLLRRTVIRAVDNVSFTIKRGEITGILGESGSGKSTIAKMLLKIYRPSAGSILFEGKDIWRSRELRDMRSYHRLVQGVFQDPYGSFNPRRTVMEVLLDALRNYYSSEDEKTLEDKIAKTLDLVGLSIDDVRGKYPHQFSGGQLQRLSIARALLVKPKVLIADEPVSMVDASTRVDILNIIIDLRDKEGVTPIVIGHDLALTHYSSDRVIVLYKGQVVEEGPVKILEDPLHPYTRMLLEAIPRIESKWSTRSTFKAPSLGQVSQGCRFADRCPYAMDICRRREPPVVDVNGERVKCWLYAEKH